MLIIDNFSTNGGTARPVVRRWDAVHRKFVVVAAQNFIERDMSLRRRYCE
jgi:hypothetical protein